MSESLVTTNTNNGVVHIQFNRGSKHNSLTLDMFDAIAAAGEQLHCNGDARVAVLSGEGPSFCAGLDMSVMKTFLSADKAEAQAAMRLLERGYTVQKFFPAEANGGAKALKAIGAPLPQVSFCPTGGVTPGNAPEYLALSNTLCVGGSWVAPKDLVQAGDWAGIEALARDASKLTR